MLLLKNGVDRLDTYYGRVRNLYARHSTDDGATFQPEIKIDDPTASTGTRALTGMTSHISGSIQVVWTDGRDDSSRSENVYADRFNLAPEPGFLNDTRLDVESWGQEPRVHALLDRLRAGRTRSGASGSRAGGA